MEDDVEYGATQSLSGMPETTTTWCLIITLANVHSLCFAAVRFNALQVPMQKRRQKLEDSLQWHQLNFDADGEQQWIKERHPAAASTDFGKNLKDAQNLHAKQKVWQFRFLFTRYSICIVQVIVANVAAAYKPH